MLLMLCDGAMLAGKTAVLFSINKCRLLAVTELPKKGVTVVTGCGTQAVLSAVRHRLLFVRTIYGLPGLAKTLREPYK